MLTVPFPSTPKWSLRGLRQRYRWYIRERGDLLLALRIALFVVWLPARMRRADLTTFIAGLRKQPPLVTRSPFASRDRIGRLLSFWLNVPLLRSFNTCYTRALTLYRFVECKGEVRVHFGIEHRDNTVERLRGHAWVSANGRLLEGPEAVTSSRIREIPLRRSRRTIVLTGAAGQVATMLRPLLAEQYDLRLTDLLPVAGLTANESFVRADLGSLDELRAAFAGAHAIVHLGGIAREATFEEVAAANIRGAYNVLEAARLEGVGRVVLASTGHAVGFYRRSEGVTCEQPPRPDTLYAASKVCAETFARLYADKHGLGVLAIRIGHVAARPTAAFDLSIWISPRDLAQLVRIGIESADLHYEVVFGISNSSCPWWTNARAAELGYRPADSADDFADDIPAESARHESTSIRLQGGGFASNGFTGDVAAL